MVIKGTSYTWSNVIHTKANQIVLLPQSADHDSIAKKLRAAMAELSKIEEDVAKLYENR